MPRPGAAESIKIALTVASLVKGTFLRKGERPKRPLTPAASRPKIRRVRGGQLSGAQWAASPDSWPAPFVPLLGKPRPGSFPGPFSTLVLAPVPLWEANSSLPALPPRPPRNRPPNPALSWGPSSPAVSFPRPSSRTSSSPPPGRRHIDHHKCRGDDEDDRHMPRDWGKAFHDRVSPLGADGDRTVRESGPPRLGAEVEHGGACRSATGC